MNLKKSAGFVVLLLAFTNSYGGDSLTVNSFNSIRLIESGNNWLHTGNSAGMVFNGSRNAIMFRGGMNLGDGGFHRIMEAAERDDYFFATESYQTLNDRIFLYGQFTYHNMDEKGARWNGTYDPYRGNPYILADSVAGTTYDKESYTLAGKIGYRLSPGVSLGGSAGYFAATGAKQKDPRPENTVTMFSVNPSLLIHKEKFSAGIDLGYRHRRESISYIQFISNSADPTYFMFKGLGFYNMQITSSFERDQSMNEVFGGIQVEKNLLGIPFLTEIRFNCSKEKIEDGSSTIRKEDAGDWDTYSFDFSEQLAIDAGLRHHRLRASLGYFNGDGIEYMQDVVYVDNVDEYQTIAKYEKFNREVLTAALTYDYRKMLDQDRLSWMLSGGVNFRDNDETYYYVPETFTSSFSNLAANLSLQKELYLGSFHFSPAAHAAYAWNLSKDFSLSDDEEITKKQRVDVYEQEFDYYTAEAFQLGGKLDVGFHPAKLKDIDQIYLNVSCDYRKQKDEDEHFRVFSVKLGFVF